MPEKISQPYAEDQIGKVRNGRKANPDSKMPDLGWDATEEIEAKEMENARFIHTVCMRRIR